VYDLSFFRNNLDAIAKRLGDRGFSLDVESFRSLDAERRAALTESERLKAQKNAESQEIGKLRKAGEDASERQARVREITDQIAALDKTAGELDERFRLMLAGVPNVPHESVPAGRSAEDNVEIKRWGTPRSWNAR
jgi:seryl-tRNA synthetase